MSLDIPKLNLGRHDWIRTSDLFRVKELGRVHTTLNASTSESTPGKAGGFLL